MYIGNVNYVTDLTKFHTLRDYMIHEVYNSMDNVYAIMNLIQQNVDCLDVSYNSTNYEINLSIKKTTMRRAKGYRPDCMYYYGIMCKVFHSFFSMKPEIAQRALECTGFDVYSYDENIFDNLCQVNCVGDKVVNIRL